MSTNDFDPQATVDKIMETHFITLPDALSAREAAMSLNRESDETVVVITHEGAVRAMTTAKKLRGRMPRNASPDRILADYVRRFPTAAATGPGRPVTSLSWLMCDNSELEAIAVVREGEVVGVVLRKTVLDHLSLLLQVSKGLLFRKAAPMLWGDPSLDYTYYNCQACNCQYTADLISGRDAVDRPLCPFGHPMTPCPPLKRG